MISQADNTIRKINLATVDVEASVHGLRPKRKAVSRTSSTVDPFEAASPTAALCPLRSAPGDLVVAGSGSGGSSLQFWSSRRDAQAAALVVSRRNDVAVSSSSSAATETESNAPRITGLAFSGDGRGLATAEAVPRPGAGVVAPSPTSSSSASCSVAPPPLAGRAGVLKLWAASASQVSGAPPYALVAEVVEPHRYEIDNEKVEKKQNLGRLQRDRRLPFFYLINKKAPVRDDDTCAGHAEEIDLLCVSRTSCWQNFLLFRFCWRLRCVERQFYLFSVLLFFRLILSF